MATNMTFIDYTTLVPADWLNNVNAFVNQTFTFENVVPSIAQLKTLSKTKYSNVFVSGYVNQGDGGGGQYYLDPTDTTSADNGGTIIVATDGGRWKLVNQTVLTPEQFGAVGDGVTDDTVPLQNLAAYLRTIGGGYVVISKNHAIFTTVGSIGQTLFDLTNCSGITFIYRNHGALTATYPNGTNVGTSWIYGLNNVTGFTVISPVLTNSSNIPTVSGVVHFGVNTTLSAGTQSKNLKIIDVYQTGGLGGLLVYANTTTPPSDRACMIEMTGHFNGTFYPANFQGNGDNFNGRYTTVNCGRSYFPYNVSGHLVYVDSNNGTAFDDIDISVYTNPNWRAETSNIEVFYKCFGGSALGNSSCFNFIQWDATARTGYGIHDIKLHFDVNTSAFTGAFISANKYLNSGGPGNPGGPDNNPRSYNFYNIEITGSCNSSGNTQNLVQLFTQANWTGEIVYSVGFRNFTLNGTNTVNFTVDGRGFAPSAAVPFYMENSSVAIPYSFTNFPNNSTYFKNVSLNGRTDGLLASNWIVGYIAPGVALYTYNGTQSIATGGGTTITLPVSDKRGATTPIVTPSGTNVAFSATSASANSFTISHNSGGSVNFIIQALVFV